MKTSSKTLLASLAVVLYLFISGCSRPGPGNNPLGTYYFTCTFGGANYNFNAQILQTGDDYYPDLGGYVPNSNLSQAGGVFFVFPDTATRARCLGLQGTSVSFAASSTITPDIALSTSVGSPFYHAMSSSDPSYKITVTNVVYLRTDTNTFIAPNGEDIYAVKGTYKALMQDPNTGLPAGDAVGTFNVQCTAAKSH